ncbi:hypothetical protein D3C81_1414140 [compost metagenome]
MAVAVVGLAVVVDAAQQGVLPIAVGEVQGQVAVAGPAGGNVLAGVVASGQVVQVRPGDAAVVQGDVVVVAARFEITGGMAQLQVVAQAALEQVAEGLQSAVVVVVIRFAGEQVVRHLVAGGIAERGQVVADRRGQRGLRALVAGQEREARVVVHLPGQGGRDVLFIVIDRI